MYCGKTWGCQCLSKDVYSSKNGNEVVHYYIFSLLILKIAQVIPLYSIFINIKIIYILFKFFFF